MIFLCNLIDCTDISTRDPRRFQFLSGSLDFHHQAIAHAISLHADERRKELEKEMAGSPGLDRPLTF